MALDEDDDIIEVGEGHGDGVSARAILRECEEIGRVYQEAENRLDLSLRNERWVHGEQFKSVDLELEDSHVVSWDDDLVRENRNLLRSFWLTWTARALEELPLTMCYPQDAGGIDVALARVCNAILDYVDQRNSMTQRWQEQIGIAQLHACAAFKVCFDPTRSTYGGTGPGDIIIEPRTIFDYWTDGSDDDADTRWVCYRRWVEVDEAIAIAMAHGADPERIIETSHTARGHVVRTTNIVSGASQAHVPITEIWRRPDGDFGRFPDGLYITFAGDVLLEAQPFPYAHGEAPHSTIRVMWRRGSPFGSTHVDDAISPQRLFNKFVSVQARRAEEFQSTYGVATPEIVEKLNSGNKWFGIAEAAQRENAIKFFTPPGPSELLQKEEASAREHIADMFGLSESLMGSQDIVGRGPAGKTVSYYKWLQSQKFGEVIKSIHGAMMRMSRQTILLMQQYASDELLLSIIGRDRPVDLQIFRQTDLSALDTALKLEPAAGASRLRAAQAEAAQIAAAEGRMDPARAAEIQRTGLDTTSHESVMADALQSLVRVALTGQPVQPDQSVDPTFAVAELERLHGAYRDYPNAEIILQILDWYRQQGAQAQAAAAQQQVGAAVPGGTMAPQAAVGGPPLE